MTFRFTPGQKIRSLPGESLNRLFDFIDARGSLGPPPGPGDRIRPADTPILVVPVKNMTGAALVERAIVGIDQSAFTPPDIVGDEDEANVAVLSGVPVEAVEPDGTSHRNRWAVVLAPIAADAAGFAVISGVVWARVDVTEESHAFAVPATGDTKYLASASGGAPIWYRKKQDETPSTGKQWALVLLGGGGGGSNIRFARVTTAFSAASGPLEADWADGAVKFQDDSTGELDADATNCKNSWIDQSWVEDAQVVVDTGYTPPRIVNGTCAAVDWGS